MDLIFLSGGWPPVWLVICMVLSELAPSNETELGAVLEPQIEESEFRWKQCHCFYHPLVFML